MLSAPLSSAHRLRKNPCRHSRCFNREVGNARPGPVLVDGKVGRGPQPAQEILRRRVLDMALEVVVSAREMGAKGRKLVEERFSCEAQLRKVEELYEKLLRDK